MKQAHRTPETRNRLMLAAWLEANPSDTNLAVKARRALGPFAPTSEIIRIVRDGSHAQR